MENIQEFESVSSEFEFVKFKDLSEIEKSNHKFDISTENDLVIIQKSFNPGFRIFPLRNSDFIGFIVNKLIEEDIQKREILRNPFSSFWLTKIMALLDTIYVFVPDISVFRDAFNLTQSTSSQKSARDFLNFLAKQSEESGGFKFLRCPGEFIVKLLNDPLFENTKIWGFLGLILRYGDVSNKDIKTEEEVVECYKHLSTYKKPILISNDSKEEYENCDPLTTSQIMKLLPTIMTDRSYIDRHN